MSSKFWESPLNWPGKKGLVRRSERTRIGQYTIKSLPKGVGGYLVEHEDPAGRRRSVGEVNAEHAARQAAQQDYERLMARLKPADDALFYFDPASGTCPTLVLETPHGFVETIDWVLGAKQLSLAPGKNREHLYLTIARHDRSGDYVVARIDADVMVEDRPFGLFMPMCGHDGGMIGSPSDRWISRREGWLFRILSVEEVARWSRAPLLAISAVQVGNQEVLPTRLPMQIRATSRFTPIGF